MYKCECGFEAKRKSGLTNHKKTCKGPILPCICGYFPNRIGYGENINLLRNHKRTCKKSKYNPNVTYVFVLGDDDIEQQKKHRSNMMELLNAKFTNSHKDKLLRSAIIKEINLSNKYINNYSL